MPSQADTRTTRTFTRRSPISGVDHEMTMQIDMDDFQKWLEGTNIQVALPYLTANEREFLKTGITGEEWDALFKDLPPHPPEV